MIVRFSGVGLNPALDLFAIAFVGVLIKGGVNICGQYFKEKPSSDFDCCGIDCAVIGDGLIAVRQNYCS